MLLKPYLLMGGITLLTLCTLVACTQSLASKAGGASALTAERLPSQGQRNISSATVVATVTMTTPLTQTPGQPPAGGAVNVNTEVTSTTQEEQPQPGEMVVYTDNTYWFSIKHPTDFVLHIQPPEKLVQLKPTPVALFRFMSPTIAKSDLGDLEPADLEVRAYGAEQTATLENWLKANNLWIDAPKVFQAANVAGLELCASTMIAPGCSYFLLGHGWVYQLTPASVDGETMAHTFTLQH